MKKAVHDKIPHVQLRLTQLASAAITALALCPAGATEYYWIPGSTDWTSPASYTNSSGAAAAPSSGDEVAIPPGCSAVLSDSDMDSFNFANSLARIRTTADDSHLVFDIASAESDLTFNPQVNFNRTLDDAAYHAGGIVKRGPGSLALGTGSDNSAYITDIIVEQGTFKLPQNALDYKLYYYDLIAVSNGATLFLCANPESNYHPVTFPRRLMGGGTITNASETTVFLELNSSQVSEFSGKIVGSANGKIRINNNEGRLELLGAENTFDGMVCAVKNFGAIENGRYVGLACLGRAGEPSSAGVGAGLHFMDMRNKTLDPGGMFRYLGTGETTDKNFYFGYSRDNPCVFDAGDHGGITFNGNFLCYDASKSPGNIRFVITGSNMATCIVNGAFAKWSGGTCSFDIVKRGTGIWRFADGAATDLLGTFTVENGTLQYETISEKGYASSLGEATLSPNGWAVALGGTNASDEAVFEYVGAWKSWCGSRPMVLVGDAHLRNSSQMELRLADVRSGTPGAKTLVLDGEGAGESYVSDVADGAGVVSVEKDGSGTWVLAGSNTFSGTLSVRKGTLKVVTPQTPYTWFRFWNKQIFELKDGKECIYCLEMGLYDNDGERQNTNMVRFASRVLPNTIKDLGCGQFNWGTDVGVDEINLGKEKRPAEYMFDGAGDPASGAVFYEVVSGSKVPLVTTIADPDSWRPMVLRLPAAANPVTSFDILEYGSGASTRRQYGVRAFALEGSVDGMSWDMLLDHDSGENGYKTGWEAWRFGAGTYSGNAPAGDIQTHTDGRRIASCAADLAGGNPRPVLENITEVSISGGGRLEAIGGGRLTLPAALSVDTVAGGAISGFSIPAAGTMELCGTLDFTGVLPLVFENVENLGNLSSWSVMYGESHTPRRKIHVRNGTVSILPIGTVFCTR